MAVNCFENTKLWIRICTFYIFKFYKVSVLEVTFTEAKILLNLTCHYDIGGLVQDCNNSIANARELQQSCHRYDMKS